MIESESRPCDAHRVRRTGMAFVPALITAALVVAPAVVAPSASADTAPPAATSTTVVPSDTAPVWDEPITATATVTGDSSGAVQFQIVGYQTKDIGSPVAIGSDGTATSTTFTPTPGDYTLQAVFTPSDTSAYATSTGTDDLSVGGASTTTTLTVNARSLVADVSVASPSQASPDGDELVEFIMDGNEITYADVVNGQAVLDYAVPTDDEHDIVATYIGTAYIDGSSAEYDRDNPVITVAASSKAARTDYGWYRQPVTVTSTCTLSSNDSAIVGGCPTPVTVSKQGETIVTKTIVAGDGGSASTSIGIYLDSTKPSVATSGVVAGARYYGSAPAIKCIGKDPLSGIASCVVTRKAGKPTSVGTTVRYTATATDKAGNTSSVSGSYTQLTAAISGASYSKGAYDVRVGHSYSLLLLAASAPHYVGATVFPATPKSAAGRIFTRHGAGWLYRLAVGKGFAAHSLWRVGVRVGTTIVALTIRVTV